MMKKTFVALALLVVHSLSWMGTSAHASGGGIAWDTFPKSKLTDQAALQNGAKLFVNYCLSCHGASFIRYNKLKDIGLTEDQIKKNLMFTGEKVGDTMQVTLSTKDAKAWFGAAPPDLTVIARSRADVGKGSGADYLYTYLRNYYRDPSKATGWNNLAFPNVGMPHVLWPLQGEREAIFEERKDPHDESKTTHEFVRFKQITPGSLSPQAFDEQVADLVAFMQWMAEPAAEKRVQLGVWVLLFLSIFTLLAWRLNAAYWKDIK